MKTVEFEEIPCEVPGSHADAGNIFGGRYRAPVPNGWLVVSGIRNDSGTSTAFVIDPEHTWGLEDPAPAPEAQAYDGAEATAAAIVDTDAPSPEPPAAVSAEGEEVIDAALNPPAGEGEGPGPAY